MKTEDIQGLIIAHYTGEAEFYQVVEKIANDEFRSGRESICTKIILSGKAANPIKSR